MNRKNSYPTKTTINLAMREKSPFAPARLIPLLVLVLLVCVAFGKFAVADRLGQAARARAELSEMEAEQARLQEAVADFDQVSAQYANYSTGWMTDSEKNLTDRIRVLDLIEDELMLVGKVRRFSMEDSVLTAELLGISLEDTSTLVERLYAIEDVREVSVHNASNPAAEESSTVLMITLDRGISQEGGDQA